jgi:hypothetical protein
MYVGKFSRKGGDEVMGGATNNAPTYNIKKAHELLGPVIWVGQSQEDP